MSIQIAASADGALTLDNIFAAPITTPITLMLFMKVVAWPSGVLGDLPLMRITNDAGDQFGELYLAITSSNAMPYGQIFSSDFRYFGTARPKAESENLWVPVAISFISDTDRTIRFWQGGALHTGSIESTRPITVSDLVLFNGVYPDSARRFSNLHVLAQDIDNTQFLEYRDTGTIAGATKLHQWNALSDWGAGTIDDVAGSTDITPPVTWTYSSDNPAFTGGSSPAIDSYPTAVRSGQTGIAYTTSNLASVTSVSVGTLAAVSLSDTTGDGTHALPALTDEVAHELFGTKTVTFNGSGPTTTSSFLPPIGYTYVTLGNDIDSSSNGIVYNFSPAAVENDQIITPDTLTPNDRGQASGEAGVYTCWHIQASTKIARSYVVNLGSVTNITFTPSVINTGRWSSANQPGGSAAWRGNEPPGMTSGSWSNRIFTSQTDEVWWQAGVNPMSIVSSSSPYDDGNGQAGRITYPIGWIGGEDAPSATGYTWAGSREIYICHDFKLSSNWQDHPTGTNKIFYLTNSGGNPAFTSFETEMSPKQIAIRNQGIAVPTSTLPNLATIEIVKGNTYLVEVRLVSNSALGVADGEAHMWINGTKTTEYTGITWNASNFTFNQVLWGPIWGGAGSTVSAEMYQEISRIWLSYKS